MKKAKKIFNFVFSRVVIVSLCILLQLVWWILLFGYLTSLSSLISGFINALSVVIVLWIINKRVNPSYKLLWTALILSSPVLGVTVYFALGKSRVARTMQRNFETAMEREAHLLKEDPRSRANLKQQDPQISNQSQYIRDYAKYPVYEHTQCDYYPNGESMFHPFLEALKHAEHFIFMEYFIIGEGIMWSSIEEILEEKASQGVDVRLIFDDWGCITTLPYHFYKALQEKGIKCAAFNPYRPVVNVFLNNRDHRKICVVDGYIGFTGGINLADEYINRKKRFGYWKDTAIRLEGEAVWSLTMMFLQMWSVVTKSEVSYGEYQPRRYHEAPFLGEGYVQPYCDTPLDNEVVGENVYMNMINRAKGYVYICTPYLIIDNEMMSSLCLAAKSGVDVKIITPGIPDKKSVFLLTQSYYEQLLDSGVKIYEYQPGFVHAKSFVCDDELAVIGTINMDYRSLYLHFEDGVWMYRNPAVQAMKADYLDTLSHCKEIQVSFCKNRNMVVRGFQSILRLLAPMI